MINLPLRHTGWRFVVSVRASQVVPEPSWQQHRGLSSAEVTTALRPFYFMVHPDLFAQHPRAQHINDASLKLLNSHIDLLINDQRPSPVSLQFYVRNKNTEGSLHTVDLRLNKPSLRDTVHGILSVFHLPTKYVDSLPQHPNKPDRKIKWSRSFYDNTTIFNPEEELCIVRKRDDLYSWLIKNMGEAEKRLAVSEPVRKDIANLQKQLVEDLGLTKLTWQRGLGTTHLRGCLQGLRSLMTHHHEVKDILRGRAVHFGNETGVSFEGDVILSTSEVRNQWLKLIVKLPEQDIILQRIPDMQKAVSNALRDIQITHRKYQSYVLLENYIQHLRRLVTALGDYRGRDAFPKNWPESLSSLQLVVESAAGPLMLSPTGQILAPSSCPPWLLVNFISENMDQAKKMISDYQNIKDREKQLYEQCKRELGLEFLEKDDSVMPDMMIQCLEGLLKAAYRLSPLLTGARLWVTQYYAVMLDGEVCVPWDWGSA